MKKGLVRIAILIVSIFILLIIFTVLLAKNEPPPQIIASFVDLDKISRISKFRSCTGHTTVPQDMREMKRSMKHYFWVKPEYVGTDAVKIYAPYDGYISTIRSDPKDGLEGEIWIIPKRVLPMLPPFGVWQFSIQHIIPRQDLKMGSEVKNGEIIGHAAIPQQGRASFDVVYGKMAVGPKKIDNWNSPFADLDSVFNHISDGVYAKYRDRGYTKERLILSREERDLKPCQYEGTGPYFINQEDPDNWVVL